MFYGGHHTLASVAILSPGSGAFARALLGRADYDVDRASHAGEDGLSYSPVHGAVAMCDAELVRELLEDFDADPSAQIRVPAEHAIGYLDGATALEIACTNLQSPRIEEVARVLVLFDGAATLRRLEAISMVAPLHPAVTGYALHAEGYVRLAGQDEGLDAATRRLCELQTHLRRLGLEDAPLVASCEQFLDAFWTRWSWDVGQEQGASGGQAGGWVAKKPAGWTPGWTPLERAVDACSVPAVEAELRDDPPRWQVRRALALADLDYPCAPRRDCESMRAIRRVLELRLGPWTPESDRYQPPGVRQAARQRKDIMGPRNEWGYERGPAHPARAPRLPSEVWGLAWSYLGLPERAAAGSQKRA